jgi:exosortase family protein XrtF
MKEPKPACRFLAIFVGLYIGLNILYGLWIHAYNPQVDPATAVVTRQSSWLLNLFGEVTITQPKASAPSVSILNPTGEVINVFEGCNGINVMIVFVSFLFAFGGQIKKMIWFLLFGIALIYVANLIRVVTLYYVAEYWATYFYYIHKYVLTAFLYALVFVLWWFWIERISGISLRNVMASKES